MNEEQFVSKNFRNFYAKSDLSVPAISQREFGVGDFGKKISRRHLSFQSDSELNTYLREQAPLFISYSLAYYEFPERSPMSSKSFLGADLIYEFDADDLKTECKQRHDSWSCPKCEGTGKGSLDNCPKCGTPVKKEQWFCPECLDATRKQSFVLLDLLENDLGLDKGISLNFSGNAGYHIHLRGDSVKDLSHEARIELLDYLTAKGLDFAKQGFYESEKTFFCPYPKQAKGWGKRLLVLLEKLLGEGDSSKIAAFGGISVKKAKELLANKEQVLAAMREKGILYSISGRKNKQFWESILSHLVSSNTLDIDRQTSADIRKIIRVPDTLHGGTGLLAKSFSREEFKEFDPLSDTVVFSDESVKVFINKSPKIYLKGNWFGPFNEEEAKLPLYAAIYLVAKRRANLVG